MFYKSEYSSPLGKIILASNERSLVGLWFEGQKYFEENIQDSKTEKEETKIIIDAKQWLNEYFQNKKPNIEKLKLEPTGNEFRKSIWKLLCAIPYGKTTTYSEIAKQITKERGIEKMSAQAVGNAIGHNPISIIIPCHRVIGKNGHLTGYAGGIEIKQKLLEFERI